MLKIFKKMLVLIPCIMFGMFLFTNAGVSAADAQLVDANKLVVGTESKENTYYFTSDRSWEFQTDYSLVKEWDTFLKYRVIAPDGKATSWSDKQMYVNNGGKFHISDYTALDYSDTVDLTTKNSVAPAGTYYVEIKYYGAYLFIEWDQKKDETVKIIVGDINSFNFSKADISYSSDTNQYTISAAVENESGVGYSLIKEIKYYFSKEAVDNTAVNFTTNMNASDISGELDIVPSSKVVATIDGLTDSSYKYLYVKVMEGNDNAKIISYNLDEKVPVVEDEGKDHLANNNDGTGVFDFNFGELILLVLVVVLIVSCALIITQKIVDYKKRLY